MSSARARVTAAFVAVSFLAACTAPGRGDEGPVGGAAASSPQQTTSAGPSSDGVIAFSTEKRGQVVVSRPDGTGVKELVSGSACCTDLSPDGSRLVFLSEAADGHQAVATMTIAGDDRRLVQAPAGVDLAPGVWAVDGQHLWLAAVGSAAGHNGVVLSGLDGGRLTWLTHPSGRQLDLPIAASPDGTQLMFLRLPDVDGESMAGDLLVVATAGGDPVRLNPKGTRVTDWWVRPGNFFPDSKQVTFAAFTGADHEPLGRVFVASVDGSSVVTVPMGSAAPASGTTWTVSSQVSPDGQWIVFDRYESVTTSPGRQGNSLFVVHPDGSGLRQLDTSMSSSVGGVWSPDGTRILYTVSGLSNATNLRWIALDGTASKDVTTSGGEVFHDYSWAATSRPT